jgi:hypothetical protein
MVSEGVSARRPVLAVAPRQMSLPADEAGYRAYLEENGWARGLPIAELSPERALAELGTIRPLAEDPHVRLAELIAARLPGLIDP